VGGQPRNDFPGPCSAIEKVLAVPPLPESWRAFLEDRGLIIVGYQVHFKEIVAGLFLFNHSCMTTLSIEAGKFQDLSKLGTGSHFGKGDGSFSKEDLG